MKTILSEQTKTTPKVIFNTENNNLTIEGKSIPFEPELFWSLILNQIKNYKIKTIEINLEYINTNSISHLIKLITFKQSNIIWFYEKSDEDMYELGKDLKNLSNNIFEFIETGNLDQVFTY